MENFSGHEFVAPLNIPSSWPESATTMYQFTPNSNSSTATVVAASRSNLYYSDASPNRESVNQTDTSVNVYHSEHNNPDCLTMPSSVNNWPVIQSFNDPNLQYRNSISVSDSSCNEPSSTASITMPSQLCQSNIIEAFYSVPQENFPSSSNAQFPSYSLSSGNVHTSNSSLSVQHISLQSQGQHQHRQCCHIQHAHQQWNSHSKDSQSNSSRTPRQTHQSFTPTHASSNDMKYVESFDPKTVNLANFHSPTDNVSSITDLQALESFDDTSTRLLTDEDNETAFGNCNIMSHVDLARTCELVSSPHDLLTGPLNRIHSESHFNNSCNGNVNVCGSHTLTAGGFDGAENIEEDRLCGNFITYQHNFHDISKYKENFLPPECGVVEHSSISAHDRIPPVMRDRTGNSIRAPSGRLMRRFDRRIPNEVDINAPSWYLVMLQDLDPRLGPTDILDRMGLEAAIGSPNEIKRRLNNISTRMQRYRQQHNRLSIAVRRQGGDVTKSEMLALENLSYDQIRYNCAWTLVCVPEDAHFAPVVLGRNSPGSVYINPACDGSSTGINICTGHNHPRSSFSTSGSSTNSSLSSSTSSASSSRSSVSTSIASRMYMRQNASTPLFPVPVPTGDYTSTRIKEILTALNHFRMIATQSNLDNWIRLDKEYFRNAKNHRGQEKRVQTLLQRRLLRDVGK